MIKHYFLVFCLSFPLLTVANSNCQKIFNSKTISGPSYQRALVIGSGSFGTGISFVLSQNFEQVAILTRKSSTFNEINNLHTNSLYFSETLPKNIRAIFSNSRQQSYNFQDTDWDLLVFAVPLSSLASLLKEHRNFFSRLIQNNTPLISLAKGIDTKSLKFTDDIFLGVRPDLMDHLVFLSGPSFAKGIIKKDLTFVTLAGKNQTSLLKAHHMISTPEFKAHLTTDTKGVLLGGAVKNVIAIAMGIVEGLGVEANTKAGFMTLLFNESFQLADHYGVSLETLIGFSGFGDIVLSAEGKTSRNKSFGLAVGQREKVQSLIEEQNNTIEGYHTVSAIYQIAQREQLNLPLFETLFHILYENASPDLLIQTLKETDIIFKSPATLL